MSNELFDWGDDKVERHTMTSSISATEVLATNGNMLQKFRVSVGEVTKLVTTSDALVPSSFLLLLVRHLLLLAWHLFLIASCY